MYQTKVSDLINYEDIFLSLVYFSIAVFIGYLIKAKFEKENPEYKFFILGLIFKIIGVFAFCLIYVFYYDGGDTTNYFFGAKAVTNILFQDYEKGIPILFNFDSHLNSYSSFNLSTGYPPHYMWKDDKTFIISRLCVPFYIIGFGSFPITSIFTALFSYLGVWRIFRLFNNLYPGYSKIFAYLILFLPTLIFWGGGIMKDSFVLGATCWITYNFYKILIVRKKIVWNTIFFVINIFLIINIKPYVLISLLPGMLFWLNNAYLKNINSTIGKLFIFPILLIFVVFIGYQSFSNLSSLMGVYGDVDSAIQQAQVIQEDLLREDQYGGNNYKIGAFDGSVISLFSVAPLAIFTALFRPLLWEVGSPTMLFSAIENSIMLIFTIVILIRTSPIGLLRILWAEPFLLYCFIFSIFFAFGVGIAGTNFGALVRYKTPLVPFFFSMIYLVYKKSRIRNV